MKQQMWAVVQKHHNGDDWILEFTINRTRSEAIERYVNIWESEDYGRKRWRRERDAGIVRCVRVDLTVSEPRYGFIEKEGE